MRAPTARAHISRHILSSVLGIFGIRPKIVELPPYASWDVGCLRCVLVSNRAKSSSCSLATFLGGKNVRLLLDTTLSGRVNLPFLQGLRVERGGRGKSPPLPPGNFLAAT